MKCFSSSCFVVLVLIVCQHQFNQSNKCVFLTEEQALESSSNHCLEGNHWSASSQLWKQPEPPTMICGFRFALSCYFGKTPFCLKGTNIAFSEIKEHLYQKSDDCLYSLETHFFFTCKMYYCMWKVCKEV